MRTRREEVIVRAGTRFVMEAPEVNGVLLQTDEDCTLCFLFMSTYTANISTDPQIISSFTDHFSSLWHTANVIYFLKRRRKKKKEKKRFLPVLRYTCSHSSFKCIGNFIVLLQDDSWTESTLRSREGDTSRWQALMTLA